MVNEDLVNGLKEELRKRKVKFKYIKKDGTEREAFGTLNSDIYGKENEPSGNSGRVVPENQVRYYDINSEGWRSFIAENLISYE